MSTNSITTSLSIDDSKLKQQLKDVESAYRKTFSDWGKASKAVADKQLEIASSSRLVAEAQADLAALRQKDSGATKQQIKDATELVRTRKLYRDILKNEKAALTELASAYSAQEKAAKQATSAKDSFAKQTKAATQAASEANKTYEQQWNHFIRMARWGGTLAGIYYGMSRGYDLIIGKGIELNKTIEDNTQGLSALISANTQNVTTTGRAVTSLEKFNMAQSIAATTMEKLRKAAANTPASFVELTEIFQQAIPHTLALGQGFGKSVDEIVNNTVKLSQRMSLIASSIGMPMDRVKEEMRSLLSANASTDSLIASLLFHSPSQANEAIRKAKAQGGTAVKELLDEMLKPFDALENIDTFSRSQAHFKAGVDALRMELAKPFENELKNFYDSMTIELNPARIKEIADSFASVFSAVRYGVQHLDVALVALLAWKAAPPVITAVKVALVEARLAMQAYEVAGAGAAVATLRFSGAAVALRGALVGVARTLGPILAVVAAYETYNALISDSIKREERLREIMSGKIIDISKLNQAQVLYNRSLLDEAIQAKALEVQKAGAKAGGNLGSLQYRAEASALRKEYNDLIKMRAQYDAAKKTNEAAMTAYAKAASAKEKEKLKTYNLDSATMEDVRKYIEQTEPKVNEIKTKVASWQAQLINARKDGNTAAEKQLTLAIKRANEELDGLKEKAVKKAATAVKAQIKDELSLTEILRQRHETEMKYAVMMQSFGMQSAKNLSDLKTRQFEEEAKLYGDLIVEAQSISDPTARAAKVDSILEKFYQAQTERNTDLAKQEEASEAKKIKFYEKQQELMAETYTQEGNFREAFIIEEAKKMQELADSGVYTNEQMLRIWGTDNEKFRKEQWERDNKFWVELFDNFDKAMENQIFDAMTGKWKDFGNWLKDFWTSITSSISRSIASSFSTSITDSLKSAMQGTTPQSGGLVQALIGSVGMAGAGYGSTLTPDQVAQLGGTFGQVTATPGGTIIDQTGKVIEAGSDLGGMVNLASSLQSVYSLATRGLGGIAAGVATPFQYLAGGAQALGLNGLAGGISNFGMGAGSIFTGGQFAGASAMGAGQLAGGAGVGYLAGMLGDKLFGAETKASTGGAIGGAIGTAILPGVGTAIGAGLGSLIGGMFGSTKKTGSGLYFGQETSAATDAAGVQSYIDYKKKSWFRSKSWTTYEALSEADRQKIDGIFETYDFLLRSLGNTGRVVLAAGRYSGESFQEAITKNFIGQFTPDVGAIYDLWKDYAKSVNSTITEAMAKAVGDFIDSQHSFTTWALERKGDSGKLESLKLQAQWAADAFDNLEKMVGSSGVTVENFSAKYDAAVKANFNPTTIAQWDQLGKALMSATEAQDAYAEALAATADASEAITKALTPVEEAIKGVTTIAMGVVKVIQEMKNASQGLRDTLLQAVSGKSASRYAIGQYQTAKEEFLSNFAGGVVKAGNVEKMQSDYQNLVSIMSTIQSSGASVGMSQSLLTELTGFGDLLTSNEQAVKVEVVGGTLSVEEMAAMLNLTTLQLDQMGLTTTLSKINADSLGKILGLNDAQKKALEGIGSDSSVSVKQLGEMLGLNETQKTALEGMNTTQLQQFSTLKDIDNTSTEQAGYLDLIKALSSDQVAKLYDISTEQATNDTLEQINIWLKALYEAQVQAKVAETESINSNTFKAGDYLGAQEKIDIANLTGLTAGSDEFNTFFGQMQALNSSTTKVADIKALAGISGTTIGNRGMLDQILAVAPYITGAGGALDAIRKGMATSAQAQYARDIAAYNTAKERAAAAERVTARIDAAFLRDTGYTTRFNKSLMSDAGFIADLQTLGMSGAVKLVGDKYYGTTGWISDTNYKKGASPDKLQNFVESFRNMAAPTLQTKFFANGGVVTSPTIGVFGEGRHPAEAFVPLPDGRTIPVSFTNPYSAMDQVAPLLNSIYGKISEMAGYMKRMDENFDSVIRGRRVQVSIA